jgi:hypothetical protein
VGRIPARCLARVYQRSGGGRGARNSGVRVVTRIAAADESRGFPGAPSLLAVQLLRLLVLAVVTLMLIGIHENALLVVIGSGTPYGARWYTRRGHHGTRRGAPSALAAAGAVGARRRTRRRPGLRERRLGRLCLWREELLAWARSEDGGRG